MQTVSYCPPFCSSPEPKAHKVSIKDGNRAGVHKYVRPFTYSNINISETSRRIEIKFHLEHHWVGENAALGFGPDWIRTLVSMATDNSNRVIMKKSCDNYSPFNFNQIIFNLAGNVDTRVQNSAYYDQGPRR